MAALTGDFGGADHSLFRGRVASSGIVPQHHKQQSQPQSQPQSQLPRSSAHAARLSLPLQAQTQPSIRTAPLSIQSARACASTMHPHSPPLSSSNSFSSKDDAALVAASADSGRSGTSRIPTPPASSSPSNRGSGATSVRSPQTRDGCLVHMAPIEADTAQAASTSSSSASTSNIVADTVIPTPSASRPPPPTNAIPSPTSDSGANDNNTHAQWMSTSSLGPVLASPPSSHLSHHLPSPQLPPPPPERVQTTIRIRDLNHIQTLSQLDSLTGNGPGLLNNDPPLQDLKFEISAMPIGDIIEMVAALLTKITTTNDHQHDALNRNATQQRQAQAHDEGSSSDLHTASPFSASVLAFHGKNVPAITILSYLSRIHKYCPTTYEVFLSLLVYFDRMTERVNDLVMNQQSQQERTRQQRQRQQERQDTRPASMSMPRPADVDAVMRDVDVADGDDDKSSTDEEETDEGLADSDDEGEAADNTNGGSSNHRRSSREGGRSTVVDAGALSSAATYFVVDSYNIHRLIIAGVTCASKFFSDVFYTNSRYAKVGGLPLAELNHLELQFLILNDFRLAIPIEDLEAYATMLVEFYARDVVGQRPRPSTSGA